MQTRREFLKAAGRLGSGLAVGVLAVARCAGPGQSRESIAARARTLDPDLRCTSTQGLWPAEIQTRTDNEYVERSAEPYEYCFNCKNFIEPPQKGACGNCRTVKGPINPGGWCKSWTART